MKHEHNVCTWTETSPSIEPAPFAVFTQYPASPSALPSLGSSTGARSCQHSSSRSTAAKAARPPWPAGHGPTGTGLCHRAPAATLHTLWYLWGCCQGSVHPDRHPRALLTVTPWTYLPLQIHEFSEKKPRWHCTIKGSICTLLSKSQIPSSLAHWAVTCVPTKQRETVVHWHWCHHVKFSWVTCIVSICSAAVGLVFQRIPVLLMWNR